ncbi:MAG: hypothetical protein JF571_12050 [Asticcacaulis sp.]|nr:hypothetical protein [Asticcacaulis sp.]
MADIPKSDGDAVQQARQVETARRGEHLTDHNEPDSFPEEGTDDKMVQARDTGAIPFSDEEATKATQAVIAAGLSGGGKTSTDWPDGQLAEALDDGTNKPGGADDSSDLND